MTRLTRILPILFGWLLVLLFGSAAHAQLEIDITEGNLDPVQIAVPDFLATTQAERDLGAKVADVIRKDLERSGLFKALDPASFLETQTNIDYNATTPDNWRRTAHKASDAIYEALTGESGYFDSRIVFIDEKGPKTNRSKRLAIMDQDGESPVYLLGGSDLVLTPRFSPNSQTIVYMSYENSNPHVYLLDIETGRRELLGDFPGMTFAPRFSPKGDKLILAMSRRGNSDIYAMDLRSRSTTRLTTDPAIDVSASYSPDGRTIVFNSDRGASPQLYTMNADGSKNERMLTESFLDESPTWSPNGRVIIFSRDTRGKNGHQVWSVDLTGQNLRRVETPGQASDPAWSPLLP